MTRKAVTVAIINWTEMLYKQPLPGAYVILINLQQNLEACRHEVVESVKILLLSSGSQPTSCLLANCGGGSEAETQGQTHCCPLWGPSRLWKVNLDLIKTTGRVNLLSMPTLWVLSRAKITFIIMTELIVDFASIRRGCGEDSAERLVNALNSLAGSLCRDRFCFSHQFWDI